MCPCFNGESDGEKSECYLGYIKPPFISLLFFLRRLRYAGKEIDGREGKTGNDFPLQDIHFSFFAALYELLLLWSIL